MVLNLTNLSLGNVSLAKIEDICLGKGQYSPECLNKWFCPQIHSYFTNTAITLVVLYVVFSWLSWAYWRFWNDKLPWDKWLSYSALKWVLGGDPRLYETKVNIQFWLQDKLGKLLIGFLLILWWFYH